MEPQKPIPVFEQVYYSKLVPILKIFEKQRKKWVTVVYISIFLFLISLYWMIKLFWGLPDEITKGPTTLYFTIVIFAAIFEYQQLKDMSMNAKIKLFPIILKPFGIRYCPSEGRSVIESLLRQTNFLGNFNGLEIDDSFWGEFKNIIFNLREANVTYTTGSGKHRRTQTKFKGIIFSAPLNKKSEVTVFIKNDFGIFNPEKAAGLTKIKLEDIEFEKFFEVYSNDQIESRYILTTTFIERFKHLKQKRHRKIEAIIFDARIHILISYNKDMYELPFFSTILKPEIYKSMLKEITELVDIVEELKLDQKIGL